MSTSDSCKDSASKSNGVCDVNADVSICANCGKGEEESHKLNACTACKMVKYCNRECQIAHRPQHKKECKKRAAELHDEKLFEQPPPEYGDCPICFLRMPTLTTGSEHHICCGKVICSGCIYAPLYDDQGNTVDNKKCPFCRTPHPTSDEESCERVMERFKANDPIAIYNIGVFCREGTYGYPVDHAKALELWHRAGKLGFADSYLNIGYSYELGQGVEVDEKKAVHYFELAAMMGNAVARYNLGIKEEGAGNTERALKHHMIAVRAGFNASLEMIQELYKEGNATKEEYTKALLSYQGYLGEIKSVQRDEAAAAHERHRYY